MKSMKPAEASPRKRRRWIADLEAKREEYQSLIDHLDYIAIHPND